MFRCGSTSNDDKIALTTNDFFAFLTLRTLECFYRAYAIVSKMIIWNIIRVVKRQKSNFTQAHKSKMFGASMRYCRYSLYTIRKWYVSFELQKKWARSECAGGWWGIEWTKSISFLWRVKVRIIIICENLMSLIVSACICDTSPCTKKHDMSNGGMYCYANTLAFSLFNMLNRLYAIVRIQNLHNVFIDRIGCASREYVNSEAPQNPHIDIVLCFFSLNVILKF